MNRLERAANERPLAILMLAMEIGADIIVGGATLACLPSGDVAAGWKVAIERDGTIVADCYGRTVLDASLAALVNAREGIREGPVRVMPLKRAT